MLTFNSKKMRNIFIVLLMGAIYLASVSCEDMFGEYLDKPPGTDANEDSIFASTAQVELFLAACYEQALISPWRHPGHLIGNQTIENTLGDNLAAWISQSDEGKHTAPWWISHQVNLGTMSSSGGADNRYQLDVFFNARWTALRMVHTMMERIDEVPDANRAYKDQIMAESKYLRASLYFDMFRRYGGVPVISRRFTPEEVEEMKVRRSSVAETVDFIVKDLDEAIPFLPDSYPSNMRGRITKGSAMALKSRTLLYAASPLFNTETPYLSMPDPADNILLSYGNYDVNRWQKAADAAKAVLDWAPAGGISLVTNQGPDKNYRYVWEIPDNTEIILADKHQNRSDPRQNTPWQYYLGRPMGGMQGAQPTHTFIQNFYEKKDGTPQTWEDSGNDLDIKYAELDYRFHQTIGYNGSFWNPQRGIVALFLGPAPAGAHIATNLTGYWLKKFVPDQVNSNGGNGAVINFPRHRLAEIYLNYAEALNEAQGPVAAAYDAVNTIRARSGMPALPGGLSKDEFRERVRKERGVEFAFEGHRWWDIRRWMIAEEVNQGDFYGLKIYKNVPATNPLTFRYERFVFEQRVWPKRFYLEYFPVSQVNLGYLVQNPGW